MSAQISGEVSIALAKASTLRQKHALSSNEAPQFSGSLSPGWKMFGNIDFVEIRELVYCPKCIYNDQMSPLPNYHMFILEKPKSQISVILIKHSFLREVNRFFPSIPSLNKPVRLMETFDISNHLALFYQEVKANYPGKKLILKDLSRIIIILLLRSLSKTQIPTTKRQQKDIGPAIDFIHNHYSTPFTLEDLARQVNYSKYYFIKVFKKEIGISPFDYITSFRLEKAKEFLYTTSMTVTEICLQCGFQNSSHFATVFKRFTGLSPTEYRHGILPKP